MTDGGMSNFELPDEDVMRPDRLPRQLVRVEVTPRPAVAATQPDAR